MDLSSSGTQILLFFAFSFVSFGQIYIEDNEEFSYQNDNYYELEQQSYSVSGDVYIIDRLTSEKEHALLELFENILETDNEVFVKITGNAISIITDSSELRDVLKYTDRQRDHSLDIIADIQEVLQVAKKNVHIYIITEEGSDGSEGVEALSKQLRRQDIRIDILHLQGDYGIQEYYGIRHRRQINFYQLLANLSGGSVINTNKQNIGSALNLLKQSIKTSLVHVMRFADHSPAGKEFRIPVDDTMTQLIFRAQVERSNPVIIAMTPAGIPPSGHPQLLGKASAGTVVGLLETNLTKPSDYGTWKITKLDFNLWDIKVDGQSSVDFTHEFLEPGPGGFGEYPIKGRPIIGNTHKLSITVPEYSKVQTVAMGMLFTREQLMPIDMKPLKNVGGRRGKSMFYEQFTIPNKDFMVGIEGRDKSGHMFRRIDPILIIPVGLKLVIPSLTGVKFYQNETLAIPFTVINKGSKEQDVDVKIEDDKKFAQPPSILSATIKPGQNFTGTFVIKAGLTVGETTTVTVTAKPYLGRGTFSQGQFEIRRFTVLDKNITTTTLTTPTTSTTSTTSTSTMSTSTSSASTSTTTISTPTSLISTSTYSASTTSTTSTIGRPITTQTRLMSTFSPQTTSTLQVTSKTQPSTISAKGSSPSKRSSTTSISKTSAKTTTRSGPAISSTSPPSSSSKVLLSSGSSAKRSTGTASLSISTASTSSTVPPAVLPKSTTKTPVSPTSTTTIPPSSSQTTTTTKPTTTTSKTSTSTQPATSTPDSSNESKNTDLPTTSVVVGITTGAVVGIAAIGTMALLFRRAILKAGKTVRPNTEEQDRKRRQSNLAWT